MKLFGQLVRTAVNIVTLAADLVTMGGAATEQPKTYTEQLLEKLKEEAEEQ